MSQSFLFNINKFDLILQQKDGALKIVSKVLAQIQKNFIFKIILHKASSHRISPSIVGAKAYNVILNYVIRWTQ